jgi:Na+/H+ antiporter NhaD/arsenite permease-like protein
MDFPENVFVSTPALQISATACFGAAVIHTFVAKQIAHLRHRFPEGSARHNFLHFLGEIEVVFGFWAFVFLLVSSVFVGMNSSVRYLDNVSFAEPVFVFCIMCMASTKPVLDAARWAIARAAKALSKATSLNLALMEFFTILAIGPILGSFITEPAAMTVCAILAKDFLDARGTSMRFRYAVLGLLFVNISIGGVFTNFAAPPVLMVAGKFGWNSAFMIANFGVKAAVSILLSTILTAVLFRREIALKDSREVAEVQQQSPVWLMAVHIVFMILVVIYHKHIPFFVALFLLFLGWVEVTKEYQSPLRLRESLLVGFFLAGLVTLGNMQAWWLEGALASLGEYQLFFGAAALTAITDNAALTYLGSLVPTLSEAAKYMLVAGSVVGGGLTVIANAPNPAGYGILRDSFGADGISPLYLFLGALPFTIISLLIFGFT